MRQLVYTLFISNNHPSFHLWWKENLVKHQKVSKYYETDCRVLSKIRASRARAVEEMVMRKLTKNYTYLKILVPYVKNETSKWRGYAQKKVKISCVLHDKAALLTRSHSEQRTRNCLQIIFRKLLTIYI